MPAVKFSPETEAAFQQAPIGFSTPASEVIQTTAEWPQLPYCPPCDQGKIRGNREHELNDQYRQNYLRMLLWRQSERRLKVLRIKGIGTVDEDKWRSASCRFMAEVPIDRFSECVLEAAPLCPINYYQHNFGDMVVQYGAPFDRILTKAAPHELDGTQYRPTQSSPLQEDLIGVNTEFFGALLGGDVRLGHDLIYYLPEQRFYFFDLMAGSYLPTTEEKLHVLLGLMLRERAAGQPPDVAALLLEKFRNKAVLIEIVAKAKALLAADVEFFTGAVQRKKWGVQPTITATAPDLATALKFVQEWVEPAEGAIMTVQGCLTRFMAECGVSGADKQIFRKTLESAVEAVYDRRVRNDLKQPDGRSVAAWKSLKLRVCSCAPKQIGGIAPHDPTIGLPGYPTSPGRPGLWNNLSDDLRPIDDS
jgi:hypothetical protein